VAVEFHSGRWTFRYYEQGRKGAYRRITLPETVTTREEAEAYQELWRQRKRRARNDRTPSSTPISALWDRYDREHAALYLKSTTAKDLRGVWFLHLAPHFGEIPIGDLGDTDITAYISKRLNQVSARKGRPVTNRSINKELAYLSAFLRWAREGAHILFDPIVIKYLPARRPIPIILTFAEMAAFLMAAEPFYRALFGCLYGMGLRIKEARALSWEHIELVQSQAIITDTKGGMQRIVPIPGWLIEVLTAVQPAKAHGPLFLRAKDGTRFPDVRRAVERARTKAGIIKRITPHLLRHAFATHHMELETNLRKIQEMLGHTRIATTEWYTHVAVAHLKTATDTFNRALTAEMAKLSATPAPNSAELPVIPTRTRKGRKDTRT